jgi:hypothetical protein
MVRVLQFLFFFGSLSFLVSCKKDKLKAPQSSFLVINPKLKTSSGQGSNSHLITDIWYYVNGNFKGVFPVGNVMPVVASGNTEITLFAGIKNNGISATRLPYALYNSITINQNIEAWKTYTLNPEFEYNSGAFFYYADDFESTGSFFESAGSCDYLNTSSFDVTKSFGGVGNSIFMAMTDAEPTSIMKQSTPYFLPGSGATVYLELNYKCNQAFNVGVLGSGSVERTAITVNPSDEWNKIYVQLTNVISTQPVYPDYQVIISATKSVHSPEIYIDNVKLIFQ